MEGNSRANPAPSGASPGPTPGKTRPARGSERGDGALQIPRRTSAFPPNRAAETDVVPFTGTDSGNDTDPDPATDPDTATDPVTGTDTGTATVTGTARVPRVWWKWGRACHLRWNTESVAGWNG